MTTLQGTPASPGIIIGKTYLIYDDRLELEERVLPDAELDAEIERFRQT